jgi:hypothetical protein
MRKFLGLENWREAEHRNFSGLGAAPSKKAPRFF